MRAVSFQTSRASVPRDTICPSMPQQILEQLELAHGELDRLAAARHFARHEIHLEIADARAAAARLTRPRRSSARMRASSSANANGLTR